MTPIGEKRQKRAHRHKRVRAKIKGTHECPRLSVFRSNRHLVTQMIDDETGTTMVMAHNGEIAGNGSKDHPQRDKKDKRPKTNVVFAEKVGALAARRAMEKGLKKAVFDRGGYQYHGIVKAVAEGARKEGLRI